MKTTTASAESVPVLWYYTRVRVWDSRKEMIAEAKASGHAPLATFWECGTLFGGCGRVFQHEPNEPCPCGGRKNEQVWSITPAPARTWKKGFRL